MHMKKYSTTIWPLALIWLVLFTAIIFFSFLGVKEMGRDLGLLDVISMSFLYIGSIMLVALVLFGWFTYEVITPNNYLNHVVCILFRRKVDIKSITHITQEGTYYALQNTIKSIYIYYTNSKGRERFLHLSMSLFDTKVLQQLFKDILEINPNIKLDKATEKLLRTGK